MWVCVRFRESGNVIVCSPEITVGYMLCSSSQAELLEELSHHCDQYGHMDSGIPWKTTIQPQTVLHKKEAIHQRSTELNSLGKSSSQMDRDNGHTMSPCFIFLLEKTKQNWLLNRSLIVAWMVFYLWHILNVGVWGGIDWHICICIYATCTYKSHIWILKRRMLSWSWHSCTCCYFSRVVPACSQYLTE